jgi:hypothetical protein
MQLRKTVWMLTALSALSLVMTGCPGDEEGEISCTSAADCAEGETCHPVSDVCVAKCSIAADCPSEEKLCAPLAGSTDSVCQCQNDTLCNPEGGTTMVCSTTEKRCVERCSSDANCNADQTCNLTSGQCEPKGGNPGDTCSGEGQSTCTYGTQFCSANKCTALPTPACQNYTNFQGKNDLGTTGVIIYDAEVVSAATDANWCGAGSATPKRVRIALSAYSNTQFPQEKSGLNGMFYVRVNGSTQSATSLISESAGNYNVSGANRERAEIIVSLCVGADSTTTSTGFYFMNGNFYCYQAEYL